MSVRAISDRTMLGASRSAASLETGLTVPVAFEMTSTFVAIYSGYRGIA